MRGVSGGQAKGRRAVEEALLEAASDLLAEVGPRATSVRDIAARAGVNHGQVHHYFGGKRPLLEEAMRRLARRHFEEVRAMSDGRVIPPPLAIPSDQRYWRAAVRAVIEGDMDLARIEIDEQVSVPRSALDHLTERAGLTEPSLEIKLALAEGTALQLGWLVLEPFLFLVAAVGPDEEDEVRERFRRSVYNRRIGADSLPPSGRGASGAGGAVDVEGDGHGAPVDEVDVHVGPEPAGGDGNAQLGDP